MILRTAIVIPLYFLVSVSLNGQVDYSWWSELHNYDGSSPWDEYIIKSPGYLGPNSLPVPEIMPARLSNNVDLQLLSDIHLSSGDNTQNLFYSLHVPVARKKVSLQFYGVLVEHYKTDIYTRDLRRSREFDPEGFGMGDINIATLVTLTKDRGKWPDMLLRIAFRIPSGSNLSGARFTDAPGYHFDILFNKKLTEKIEIISMAGFYAWQVNFNNGRVLYFQNDAILYGAGLVFNTSAINIEGSFAGYSGYIGNRDSPVVLRLKTEITVRKSRIILRIQQGLNEDFDYTTVRFGVQIPIYSLEG